MVLRVSDLPVINKNELSLLTDENSLFEVSTRGDGYDSWKSKAITFGDLKQQVILSVATFEFELSGDKTFNDNVTVEGDLHLSGDVIIEGDHPEENIFHVKTNSNTLISLTDNTISAQYNNNFYGQSNRFFGDVYFYELSDETATNPLITISHGVIKTNNDIHCGELHGIASSARWGDLAEFYVADADYEPGTLIRFGGEKEITIATPDKGANGVVTTKPGLSINSGLKESDERHIKGVALVGRVPVKVKGRVNRFDNITLSDIAGVGISSRSKTDTIIGKSLTSKDTDEIGLVECVVKMTL